MSKDIIIVPTYDRPEFLWVCLEQLSKVDGIENKIVWICEDIHADKPKSFTTQMEMLATIREWEKQFGRSGLCYYATPSHTTYGNSFNVLSSLKRAYESGASAVYLIEDDVLVTKDFFEWNDQVFNQLSPWVVCTGRLNRSLNFAMNGPDAMDESNKDIHACKSVVGAYNSWATCFSKQALADIVTIIPPYERFCAGFEQDIMIQDWMQKNKRASVWPYVPRAFHFGWRSYHRCGRELTGVLEEKVKFIRKSVRSKSILREMASLQEMDVFSDPTETR